MNFKISLKAIRRIDQPRLTGKRKHSATKKEDTGEE